MIGRKGIGQAFWRYWVPPLSIGILIILVCYKFVFFGMVPINSDWLVNTFEPWKSALGKERIPYEYNDDIDPVLYLYPIKYVTVRLMKEGVLPLWNPYILSGTPLWGNNFATPLNPLNVVFFFLPFDIAWGLFLVLQLTVAGFSTYGYMRELGIDRWPSAVSAYAYSLNGTFVVWLSNVGFVGVYAWVPLFLWVCERALRRNSRPLAVILGYILAIYFFSGLIQIAVYSLLFSVVYLGMRVVQAVIEKQITLCDSLMLVGIVMVIGTIVSTPQISLEWELIQNASRSTTQYAGGSFINPPMLLSFVSPYFFGLERGGEVGRAIFSRGLIRLNPPYVGILASILAIIGWFWVKGWRRYFYSLFSVVLVGVFLMLAIEPINRLVLRLVPLFGSVDHYRIMGLCALSISVLGGFGFHALLNHSLDSRFKVRLLVGCGVFAGVVLGGIQALSLMDSQSVVAAIKGLLSPLIGSHPLRGIARFIEYLHTLNHEYGSVLLSKQVFVPTALLAAGLAIVSLWELLPKWQWLLKYGTLGIIAVDLAGHALVYPVYSKSRTVYPETGAIRFLKSQHGIFRILGISDRQGFPPGDMLPPSTNLVYGFYDIRGYENLHSRWYYRLMTGKDHDRTILELNEVPKSWLNFLNVRFILTSRSLANSEHKLVYDGEIKIYENRAYTPRARFITLAEFYNTEDEVLRRVRRADFDPESVVVLQEDKSVGINAVTSHDDFREEGARKATVQLIAYKANALEVIVETDRPGWLVLSESFFPGWAAWVNEVPTPVLRANYAFRAVAVDKGYSRVTLRYRPHFEYFVVLMVAVIPATVWFLLKRWKKEGDEAGPPFGGTRSRDHAFR